MAHLKKTSNFVTKNNFFWGTHRISRLSVHDEFWVQGCKMTRLGTVRKANQVVWWTEVYLRSCRIHELYGTIQKCFNYYNNFLLFFFLNLLGENEMNWHDCMCGLTSTTVESLGCFTLWMSQCAHLWATSLFSVLWELGILGFASPLGRYYPPLTKACSSYLCYPGITSNEQLGTSHSGRLTGLASETLFVQ